MTKTREQRIVEMFDSLNAMDTNKRTRLAELADAARAHRQLTVEQARLYAIKLSDPTKENVARYLDYTEDTVAPSKAALDQLAYELIKAGIVEDVDAFRADMADQFGELREELGAIVDEVATRVKTGTAAARSRVTALIGSRAAKI